MVELGTRRTYRKGACRKLSTCRLRAPALYSTEGRLVNHLQCKPRFDRRRIIFACPGSKKIPGAQPQVLWNKEPQSYMSSGDLIGQHLTHLPFKGDLIYFDHFFSLFGKVRFNLFFFALWAEFIGVFF
jgi:hypothetical protein